MLEQLVQELKAQLSPDIRKWAAFGTGVGIEITMTDLYVSVVRVRPSGARNLGKTIIANFRDRQANEWGVELSAFLKKLGCAHLAATVHSRSIARG